VTIDHVVGAAAGTFVFRLITLVFGTIYARAKEAVPAKKRAPTKQLPQARAATPSKRKRRPRKVA
jgi:hypothetical protein